MGISQMDAKAFEARKIRTILVDAFGSLTLIYAPELVITASHMIVKAPFGSISIAT